MGLDLTIHPVRHAEQSWWLLCDELRIEQDYTLFARLGDKSGYTAGVTGKRLEAHPVPSGKHVTHYDDDGCKDVTTDAYGSPLTYLTAGEMTAAKPGPGWNTAVWQFLFALPPETPVILYWC